MSPTVLQYLVHMKTRALQTGPQLLASVFSLVVTYTYEVPTVC